MEIKVASRNDNSFFIFSGSSNISLAKEICSFLGLMLGKVKLSRFSDGEIQIEVFEEVENKDIFVVQSTCFPASDNLLELLLLVDALKRACARRITAVIPYYGYSRQDKKTATKTPISAKLIADLLVTSGVNHIITMDLHSSQIHGFFDVPVGNFHSELVMHEYVNSNFNRNQLVIVSPDVGGLKRVRSFSERLGCGFAIIDKYRPRPNEAVATSVIGNVFGKVAIIYDDMIDTGGTLIEAAMVLSRNKAKEIHVCCTHPVLSGSSVDRIMNSSIKSLVVTNTIPFAEDFTICDKIVVLSVANILGEAIARSVA